MNILGGLDSPSAGRAVVAGHVLGDMGRRERTDYRRRVIGFVWQQTSRNLFSYLTARQNVELPMLLDGVGRGEREARATGLLARVGLARAWRPSAGAPLRRRAATRGDRRRACQRARGPVRRRAHGRARHDHGPRRVRPASDRQPRARRDDRGRHPRPAGQRAGEPHGRHPRRADEQRDAPPERRSPRRATTTSSARSTPCSTEPDASSCRAATSRPWVSSDESGWRSNPTTSASGRTATTPGTAWAATAGRTRDGQPSIRAADAACRLTIRAARPWSRRGTSRATTRCRESWSTPCAA